MLFVQHNMLAENANRQLKVSTGKNAKITEKLSSGYKINRAADDAAGLSISEKMRRQVRGLHQTVDNISEGVGYVQTAEGALNEVHDMLQRINELAVKAANGTNTVEDRAYINSEVQHLKNEMNRIFSTTTYNEKKIWEPGERRLLGYRTVRAVEDRGTNQYNIDVTNKNYDVLPGGSYYSSGSFRGYFDVLPYPDPPGDQKGIKIGWKGYNGTQYYTKGIEWDTLKQQGYSFEVSDFFDKDAYPELFDGNQPVFTHRLAFSPAETATEQDIADSITGCRIPVTADASMRGVWEDANSSHFQIGSEILNYSAAYASLKKASDGHNFDAKDDMFLEEVKTNGTNLTTCPKYAGKNDQEKVDNARKDKTNW